MRHDLASVPSSQLTARLYELRRQERHLEVEFLVYLGEVDRRHLYAELAFPSLFAFLTDYLGYTGSSAYRRMTAARLVARFPVLVDYLADSRLNLTTLCELRHVLDEEHLHVILARAAGRSEPEVKRLVAELRPRPAPPDLVRRLPARTTATATSAAPAPLPPPPPASPPARVEPISATQHVLRATVSDAFVRDLDAVRDALSHKLPGASLEAVLHECLRVTLEACEKRRRGAGRPAANENGADATAAPSRYVPTAVRDEVWRRDQGRCTYEAEDGRRCASTHKLQLHHIVPFARGGLATAANLTLRCACHNQLAARQDFGEDQVEAAVERARQSRAATGARQGCLF